ncbi:competence type IV pilus minor pilin ComGD [Gracilibacillus alcaliphilus]|uniref:competence type IV pilus minor pilin ComGD n=1 Tax=Gracilibacillus alcaliphilus TaxID=1401441 RepID=UPI00195787B7|nr:competence type IV pilus minor pilin ComGD [Gracilibacillus alcaliphilus]MBM7675037.1 competence protein ComGD [Gracilibacillus alcaliphilus]
MKNQQAGFTLVELLFSLAIISFLLIISSSLLLRGFDSIQYQSFQQQFHQDLLYLQQLSLTQKDNVYLEMNPLQNKYTIRQKGWGRILIERNLPSTWKIQTNSLGRIIEFSRTGNIRKPGAMRITTNHSIVTITCPFGKGGCYSEKR